MTFLWVEREKRKRENDRRGMRKEREVWGDRKGERKRQGGGERTTFPHDISFGKATNLIVQGPVLMISLNSMTTLQRPSAIKAPSGMRTLAFEFEATQNKVKPLF